MRRTVFAFLLCMILFAAEALQVNAASSPVSLQMEVKAELTGDTPAAPETFTFVLEAVDNAPMPKNNRITIAGEGRSSFLPISYTELETYTYTLREIDGKAKGYIYDDTIYDVTVQITADDEGNLQATEYVSEQGSDLKEDEIVFVNRYNTDGTSFDNSTPATDSVQTGDNSDIKFWCLICSISLAAFLLIAILSCKNRKTQQ